MQAQAHRRRRRVGVLTVLIVGAAVGSLAMSLVGEPVQARSSGIVNRSGNPDPAAGAGASCSGCHQPGAEQPTVTITAPDTAIGGEAVDITVTIDGGPGAVAGFNASVSGFTGQLIADDIETQVLQDQITHTGPKVFDQGQVSFSFEWVPPIQPSQETIYAAGISADNSGNNAGDAMNQHAHAIEVIAGDVAGDVTCTGTLDIVDAMVIAQYSALIRDDVAECPLNDPATELVSSRGDVDGNQNVNIVDALFIAQCSAAINNAFCPPPLAN